MTVPAMTELNEKLMLVEKYTRQASIKNKTYINHRSDQDFKDTDLLAGWDNPSIDTPDHLKGNRWFNFKDGQAARKLRNQDKVSYLIAYQDDGSQFSKTYKGSISHRQAIKICEKANALNNIEITHVDRATGKKKTRNIGY